MNLHEIKQVKREWPDRAMVVSLMVPATRNLENDPQARRRDRGDGVELNSVARTA